MKAALLPAKEIPVLFKTPMVRAILDRGKTQTRRLLKPGGHLNGSGSRGIEGARAGDVLWVRENWQRDEAHCWIFQADLPTRDGIRWKPSIFMPREACRIELEVIAAWNEPVQDLTDEAAIAEGIFSLYPHRAARRWTWGGVGSFETPIAAYHDLWNSINPAHPWDTNPPVRVIAFKRRET